MVAAIPAGFDDTALLEEKREGSVRFYEYADKMFLRHLAWEPGSLDEVEEGATPERLDIR